MPPAENGGVRAGLSTRIGVALALCAVAAPATAQAACSTRVTRASAVAEHPARLPRAVPEVGRAPTACPGSCWPPSARSSRATGAIPGAYVPHTRGVLGPMQFQAGSNKAARRVDARRRPGLRRHLGHLAQGRPGHPPYRMDDPDDEIAAAAAKIAYDAGSAHLLAARAVALQRAALLPQDRAAARRAPRHELGLRPARGSPSRRRSPAAAVRDAATQAGRATRARRDAREPARRTTRSRSRRPPPTTSPTASPTSASSRCWPGSRSATASSSASSDRARPLRGGHAQGLEPLVRPRGDDQRGRRPGRAPGLARRRRALGRSCRRRPRRSGRTRSARPGRARPTRAGSPGPTSRPRSTSASTPSGAEALTLERARRLSGDLDVALHALRGVALDGAVELVRPGLRERDREASRSCPGRPRACCARRRRRPSCRRTACRAGTCPCCESVNVYLTPCLSVFGTPVIENSFSFTLIGRRRRGGGGRDERGGPRAATAVRRIGRTATPSESDAPSTRRAAPPVRSRRQTAAAASRFGRTRRGARRRARGRARAARARSRAGSSDAASASKSASVQRWMLGVSCQGCGSVGESRHAAPQRERRRAAASARSSGTRRCRRGATRIIPASTAAGRRVVCSVHESSTTSNAPSPKSRSASSMSPSLTGTPRRDAGEHVVAVDLDAVARRSRARRSGARAGRRRRSRGRARASRRGTMPATTSRSGLMRRRPRAACARRRPRPCGGTRAPAAGTSRGRAARRSRGT